MDAPTALSEKLEFHCCIAGGGPAGMMLGFLLARAGIDVVVLEKHADFLRDFRGDTIHPSTLEVMQELGILEMLLQRPHQQLRELRAHIGDMEVVMADVSRLPTQCPFVALMPQWDFLNFLAEQARRYPTFHLRTQAEVTGLIEEAGRVTGVRVNTPGGALEICVDLVVGADGRNSIVRDCSGIALCGVCRRNTQDGHWQAKACGLKGMNLFSILEEGANAFSCHLRFALSALLGRRGAAGGESFPNRLSRLP
jgi:2-polyprenyl-6-methoxyphenol hydroxylase-like FAD-dependent oxidoreductase